MIKEYKQLSLVKPRTGIIAKICGIFLILLGFIIFLTGVIAIITIIGIFYTFGAALIAYALGLLGLSLFFGLVKAECPYCGAKLKILPFRHSLRCIRCFNLILLKWKDEK
ncbi:hypothetical protein HYW21_07270 [Candidatus Woesearchaeota archaeon]|nr:hypothetical protein [Candidatus Woesearchaeota archaeon]